MSIVYDIETRMIGKRINADADELVSIAFYDIENDEYSFFMSNEREAIKDVFKKHRLIISYNGNDFDNKILMRERLMNVSNHIHVDLYEVMKKRGTYLGLKNMSLSLANVAKKIMLESFKQEDFDYKLLQKKNFTKQEINTIKEYNIRDVKVTYELYKHVTDYFLPFKQYLEPSDQLNMKWLTCSMATFAYKVICKITGMKEEYNRNYETQSYDGGYVAQPTVKEKHGTILAFDFSSLYPSVFIQCNLFSNNCNCCKEEEKWKGNNFFTINNSYCKRNQGVMEKELEKMFKDRLEFKKTKDTREYALKIILNSLYGIVGNPAFKNVHDYNRASDCTSIARTCVQHASKIFTEFGYEVLYIDTDSNYVYVPEDKTVTQAVAVAEYITKNLQENMPFTMKNFSFKIDDEIKHIFFFDKKKMYVYVTNNNKLVIKGLPIIKSDSTALSKKVFKKYMRETIIKEGKINFDTTIVKEWVYKELEENKELLAKTFKVMKSDSYKLKTQLQAMISDKYGEGRHKLIANKKYGVGKSKKFCTVKEFEEQQLKIDDLVLDNVWKELEPFMNKKVVSKKSKSFVQKSIVEVNNLMRWCS